MCADCIIRIRFGCNKWQTNPFTMDRVYLLGKFCFPVLIIHVSTDLSQQ